MNHGSASGIGSRGDKVDRNERESVEKAVRENAERFARALLPYVSSPPPPPPAIPTTGGWRGGDEVLTPPRTAQNARAGATTPASDGNDAASERVVIDVDSADLGRLSLVLDRSATGVRVLIGVADGRVAALMAPEREALLERLVGNGVRVQSVQIVGQRELGTLLAPTRSVGSAKTADPRERVEPQRDSAPRRRGSRKLDVIG